MFWFRKTKLHGSVSLGEYALPPDKMTDRLGGIPRGSSTEYSEPYETQLMLQALKNEGKNLQERNPSPSELVNGEIYSLAKNVVGPTENLNRTAPQLGQSTDKHFNNNTLNSSYEEPWDTQWKLKQFTDICDKAETASNRRTSSSSTNDSKSKMTDVYEDAWDTANKQKELEQKIQDAQRRKSESTSPKYDYEEPAGSRKFSFGQADYKTKQKWTPAMKSPVRSNLNEVYTSNYESPWDNVQLEDRLSRVGGNGGAPLSPLSPRSPTKAGSRSSQSSDSSPGPPDFPPPPVPVAQTYEEAWDIRPQAKAITMSNDSMSESKQLRSSQSFNADALSEQIDPKVPLDIQKFYHGGISRKHAEELLLIHKIGSYLVRRSETQKNVFSLSLKGVGGILMHLRIGLHQGEYILGENSQPFPTVPELINYYTKHELPIQNANHIRLQFPIPRPQGVC